MLAVSASELASIQAEAVSAVCDQSCSIYTHGTTRGTTGESLETYTHTADTVVGLVEPTGGELQNFDFVIADKVAWKAHFPVGTALYEQDHVVTSSQTLVVQVLLNPRSYAAFLSAIVSELK